MNCPKCDADISDSYEPDDWSVGIVGGWYCHACDLGIAADQYSPMEGDVAVPPIEKSRPLGTPLSELSGQPGKPGYDEFKRIAKSWGYE